MMASRTLLAILSVLSVLIVQGSAVNCTMDASNPCKCSFIDEWGVMWGIDMSEYFFYP